MSSCEVPDMLAANCSPSSPINEAAAPGSPMIARTFEGVQFDIDALIRTPLWNESWKLCCLPTHQFKFCSSSWDRIQSAPGIYVARKSSNGKFYEVAVNLPCIRWFHSNKLQLRLGYDPTAPADSDVRVYGIWEAKRRAQAGFLQSAVMAIRSGPRGLRLCYFQIAQLRSLEIPLEWGILNYDIMESELHVQKKFTQCLVFLGLNLLQTYDGPPALKLLEKDQDELLQVFTDLSKVGPSERSCAEIQKVSLVRCLLEFSGGRVDAKQHERYPHTAGENLSQYGSLIDITGPNWFGNFESQKMLDALSRSKVFTDDDIHTLNIVELNIQMKTSLPIGYLEGYLDLPGKVLHGLGSWQVDDLHGYITNFYREQPSLNRPENHILLLLTWSSEVNALPHRVLGEWAASDDGLSLRQRLTRDIQDPQITEQLALTLAAFLCYKRLLPYTPDDTTQSIKGSYLADFDALMNGEPLSNERAVFERMVFSLLRVLDTFADTFTDTFTEDYSGMFNFLAEVIDTFAPLLEPLDGFSDQYWAGRMKRLTHKDAYEMMSHHYLLEMTGELGTDGDWTMLQFVKL